MQLIGLLHVVFDALAFRNDVGFWKGREDLRGLSSRGVIFNAGSTLVIFLYLLDGDGVNSIVLATYAFSTALELWKLTKVVAMRRRARAARHTSDGAHLNTLGAVPLTLPPVPVWALAGTLR